VRASLPTLAEEDVMEERNETVGSAKTPIAKSSSKPGREEMLSLLPFAFL
jgi:hypothetical protein